MLPQLGGSVDRREELLALHRIGIHGLLAGLPVGGADLIGVGLHVLEGLQNAQGFVDAAAHGQVVDRAVHDHTLRIDDEQAAQSDAGFLIEHFVGAGDLFFEVGHQGIGDVAEATGFAIGLHPGQVAELAVNRDAENLGVAAGEIAVAVAEGDDLRRADEGEVEGIEEQHHVLTAVLGEGHLLEFLIHHRSGGEVGGRQANEPGHGLREGVGEREGNGSGDRVRIPGGAISR